MPGDGPLPQYRASELEMILATSFQRRAEPNFAWKSVCSHYLALPGLRGFWPMSAFDSSGNAADQSGFGMTATYNGNPAYVFYDGFPLAPYILMDGTGDYLSRADAAHWQIEGTESYVASTRRGLTIGGWFQVDTVGQARSFIAKWNDSGANDERSYLLHYNHGNTAPQFNICDDGTAGGVDLVTSTATWTSGGVSAFYFIVGRFSVADDEIKIWVDNHTDTANPVSVVIHPGTADLNIGAYNNGAAGLLDGRASLCFVCATALSDTHIFCLYEYSRALFGK